MKKSILILISLIGCASFAASETVEFEAKGLRAVSVDNTTGNVTILTTDGPKATVVATKHKFSDACRMTVDRAGNRLVIKVENTSNNYYECHVEFQVAVPKEVDLNLVIGSGNLLVNDTQGELAFRVGSSNVLADGTFKKIDGRTGSGNVEVKGLTGGGEVRTGSGEIDLTYVVSSLDGDLDLRTGSGNAIISFPKGSKVKTTFKAGSGELSNELGDDPAATFKVSMTAGSGNLKIKSF